MGLPILVGTAIEYRTVGLEFTDEQLKWLNCLSNVTSNMIWPRNTFWWMVIFYEVPALVCPATLGDLVSEECRVWHYNNLHLTR